MVEIVAKATDSTGDIVANSSLVVGPGSGYRCVDWKLKMVNMEIIVSLFAANVNDR